MTQFINSLGEGVIIFLLFFLIIIGIIIEAVWFFIKTAIARGVEDGIYNAVVKLYNKGIINKTAMEIEEIKQVFNPNIPPTED